jgi:hypothetical protein
MRRNQGYKFVLPTKQEKQRGPTKLVWKCEVGPCFEDYYIKLNYRKVITNTLKTSLCPKRSTSMISKMKFMHRF